MAGRRQFRYPLSGTHRLHTRKDNVMAAHAWRPNPLLYEINTWTWLYGLSEREGRPITLDSVPDDVLDALAGWGLDAIWLMGVWERSPASRQIAREHPALQAEYRRALPDFTPDDISGSPYAIRRYEVDATLGGRAGLAALRERLAARDLRLILDFVPNHTSHDCYWLDAHPEYYLHGTERELAAQPDHFFRHPTAAGEVIFANGRDPYYPAWTDTAQLNPFSPHLRQQVIDTLRDIATQCDGVRCDMAMLVTSEIVAQTWGARAGDPPAEDYWREIIPAVKAERADFLFISEVYWDLEWELQQQGFDYTYDKELYNRLHHAPASEIRAHLQADLAYQQKLVRMIENHDEARAAASLGIPRSLAAAVLISTLPGATLLHEGQFQGHRVKLPVQLRRRPHEADHPAVEAFYHTLLDEATQPIYHTGDWALRAAQPGAEGDGTHASLIAYTWRLGEERRLIAINYSDAPARGVVPLPDFALEGQGWTLRNVLERASATQPGHALAREGVPIALAPWQAAILALVPRTAAVEPAQDAAQRPT